jgi:Spy/CpxP family protein refolding chaperone
MRKSVTVLTVAALAVLLVLPLVAEAAREGGRRNPEEILHNPRLLARYLELTPEQVTTLRQLLGQLEAKVKPLREEQRTLGQELRTQLAAASPNACAVGETTVDIHENGEAIRTALEEFDAAFTAILTPEQRARYEALKELARRLRGGEGDEA